VREQRAAQDQRARALGPELPERGARHIRRAEQVGDDHPFEDVRRDVLEFPVRHDRRRVHPHVDAPESVDGRDGELLDVLGAGHVGRHGQRIAAAPRRHRVQIRLPAGGEHEAITPFGERQRRRPTDAAGRTGHHHHARSHAQAIPMIGRQIPERTGRLC
jgi:hypothetical protein